MKRKNACILIMVLIITCFSVPAYAAEIPNETVITGTIDFNNLEENPNVVISEPLTYDEMLSRYAQNANISIEEARKELSPKIQPYSVYGTNGTNDIVYRELVVYLDVTSEYRPHLSFFCETAQGTSTFNILSIYSVQLVRKSVNYVTGEEIVKQFNGQMNAWLRGVWEIEYFINGDFYNNGTTTTTGGGVVNAELNEKVDIGFNASMAYATNYYAYIYEHDFLTYFNS
jgi:hypothetical protein